ncbi:MAG: FAD-dependent oxidoreductase [Ramlibacter sp.]
MAVAVDATGEVPDLVVVGAGAAGMTAALVAALQGLRVVLCEASQEVGGTTATSAGTLWVPGNPHAAPAGHQDSIAAAAQYLEHLAGPDDAAGRRAAFLQSVPEALAYLEQRSSAVRFASSGMHPDYLTLPGAALAGRAVGPLPFDGRLLGPDFIRVRPPLPEFMVLGGMMVGKADIQALIRRHRSGKDFLHSARLVLRYAVDRLRHPRGTRLVMGNALVARLLHSLRTAGVEIRFGWRLREIAISKGQVQGALFQTTDGVARLQANAGVVLATGGVGHDAALRRELLSTGDRIYSLACESVRGEGLQAARRAGARLKQHPLGNLLWQPVSRVPRPDGSRGLFPHIFLDRAKPGLIAVDAAGRRFVDEATSYHYFVEALMGLPGPPPHGRAWLVCDAAFVRRYGLGIVPPGTRSLARWVATGYIHACSTLEELGRRTGIAAEGLRISVERMNAFAASGNDPDFGKGSAELDRFNGDPDQSPNACLGTIAVPPFVALEVHAADAASSAGLATTSDGEVLDDAGNVIRGLFACGNDAASIFRGAYPGPGATLGPAVVFGYRVARAAAARATR